MCGARKVVSFLENPAIFVFRPVELCGELGDVVLEVEPAGRVRAPGIGPEGSGDHQASPGHRTMSLWHPQTDWTRLDTLYSPPQILDTFRDICKDLCT